MDRIRIWRVDVVCDEPGNEVDFSCFFTSNDNAWQVCDCWRYAGAYADAYLEEVPLHAVSQLTARNQRFTNARVETILAGATAESFAQLVGDPASRTFGPDQA